MADLIVINKADGTNRDAALRAKREYENALSLFPVHTSGWKPPVKICSALEESGIAELWEEIDRYLQMVRKSSYFSENRRQQSVYWMYEHLQIQLREHFLGHPKISASLQAIEKEVENGTKSSFKAASDLIKLLLEQ